MKKYLFAIGSLLTTIAMLGCSGTPENQTAMGSGQDGSNTSELAVSSTAPPLAADSQTVRIGSISWYVNYEDALADAKRTNRPVWLHFGENPG